MVTIDVSRTHALSKTEAKRRAEDLARHLQETIDLDWKWDDDKITFAANRGLTRGATGLVSVKEDEVHVVIELPPHLGLFRPLIRWRIDARLDAALGDGAPNPYYD